MSACFDSPGPFTTQPMTATFISSTPGCVSRHSGIRFWRWSVICWAISWKNVDVVRPQPGHAETWGRNERRPERLQDLLGDLDLELAAGAGLRRERDADRVPDPLVEQQAKAGRRRDDALHPHAGLGQPEVERIVGARREPAVRVDEVAHARHLRRQDDPVVAEARLLGQLGGPHRRLDHRVDHHVAGVARLGGARRSPPSASVSSCWSSDPQLTPIRTGLSLAIAARTIVWKLASWCLRADVARVDPVLVERRGHLRVVHEQLVAVVVEVADDRHVDAEVADLARPSPGRPRRPRRC